MANAGLAKVLSASQVRDRYIGFLSKTASSEEETRNDQIQMAIMHGVWEIAQQVAKTNELIEMYSNVG